MLTTDRITTPFSATSTAAAVAAGIDLTGKRAVITGASSGIGIETARVLALAGAEVTLAVRDTAAGEKVAAEINAAVAAPDGIPRARVAELELAHLASVQAFAALWAMQPLHLLINNAGIMATPFGRNPAGWEQQFATNHLGHFALATALRPALAAAGGARIVSLSSRGHQRSPVVFEDINFDRREYDPFLAYGQSKTANILFAVEATNRWAGDGIYANAVHPGGIRTNLTRYLPDEVTSGLFANPDLVLKTVEQGAATSVLVATSPLVEGIGGRYFEDCNQAVQNSGGGAPNGVADYALDPDNARRLWELSEEATG
ncbi:MAG TPA: SDR family NAD(P)-dependent oxidoreductase [Sporichthya sp.]|nr:SDR family NAD(P)-dependent oxidoreductase [Sporichthya sp.]